MKRKVLFMIINMNVGGTEKALLNMIEEMQSEQYDITILLLEKYGGFLDSIPSRVHVEVLQGYNEMKDMLNKPPKSLLFDFLKKGSLKKGLSIIFFHFISKFFNDRSLFIKYLLKDIPDLKNEYDIAIAYAGPMDLISYFIAYKIKSKKKIQWIHFDITKIGFNGHFASKIYRMFDKIFVVSEEARKKLISVVPSVREKTDVFINIVSPKIISSQSKRGKGFGDNFDGIRILTVGRLSTEKGQDLGIKVLSRLIKDGYKVKWYCLGEGSSRIKYEELVEGYNLKEKFIFLGPDPNPYPYMEQCDIYVQPSRYEGYCLTLMEARCLNKPIVTTDVNGAREQIKDRETGIIVDINEDAIYEAIKELISNKNLCNKLSENLAKERFNHSIEMNKLINLMEGH